MITNRTLKVIKYVPSKIILYCPIVQLSSLAIAPPNLRVQKFCQISTELL